MPSFFIGLFMGLFSFFRAKRTTHRFAVAQRIMDDKDFKYSSKIGMHRYLQKQRSYSTLNMNESITDYLQEASQHSLPNKFEKVYRYAKRKSITKPKVTIANQNTTNIADSYKQRLKRTYPDANVIYARVGTKDFYHYAWKKLFDEYGYDGKTNELKTLSLKHKTPCYLHSGQLYLSQQSAKDYDFIAQTGLSFNHGKCFDREKNYASKQPEMVIADRDYFTFTYAYAKEIPDTEPPSRVVINYYDNQRMEGYAEHNSRLEIYHKGQLITSGQLGDEGYFRATLKEAYDTLMVRCVDASGNASVPVEVDHGYINPLPADTGSKPTVTREIVYETLEVSLADINPTLEQGDKLSADMMYLQAGYVVNDTYHLETRKTTAEEILNHHSFDEDIGDYYPRLYTRFYNTDITKHSSEYRLINGMFKQASLDFQTLSEQLKQGIGSDYGNTNYVYLGLDANVNKSKNDTEVCEYLYHYFLKLYERCEKTDGNHRLGLSFKVSDKYYTQVVEFEAIELGQQSGKITKVGKYKILTNTSNVPDMGLASAVIAHNTHTIVYQKSENQISYIKVQRLKSSHIHDGGWVTAWGDDENLVIPLDRKFVKSLTPREREVLFFKCMHVHVFITKVTKQKWYQTKWFKAVMAVLTVVLTVVAAPAGASFAAIMQAVLVNTAIATVAGIAVSYLTKVAVKLGLSPEVAGAIAFIATVVASAYAGGGINFSHAFNANTMLRALNVSFDIVGKVSSIQIGQVQQQMETFQQQVASQKEQLAKAQAMLNTGVIPLDMELLTSPVNLYVNLGESVEEFYTRTLNVDVTYITQNIASQFVDITTLPPDYRVLMARLTKFKTEDTTLLL